MRICKTCWIEKPLNMFSCGWEPKAGKIYYKLDCKECINEKARDRSASDPRRVCERCGAEKKRINESCKSCPRVCKVCGIEKPLDQFVKKVFAPGNRGYAYKCKACNNDERREPQRLRMREKYKTPEHKAYMREYMREARKRPEVKAARVKERIKYNWGSEEKYKEVLAERERVRKEREERKAIKTAINRARREAASVKKREQLERFRNEFPDLYVRHPKGSEAFDFLMRYYTDEVFRDKEIKRAHDKKTRGGLVDDGTIGATEIKELFSVSVCPYCGCHMGSTDKTLDHIVPRSRDGVHSIHNVLVCCRSCNASKSNRNPDDWIGMIPEKQRGCVQEIYRTKTSMILGSS